MAPTWTRADGAIPLLLSILGVSLLYAISVGSLIISARLLSFVARHYLGITADAATKAWIALSLWLAAAHLVAAYTMSSVDESLASTLVWAMIAVFGLSMGVAVVGAVVGGAVLICWNYL